MSKFVYIYVEGQTEEIFVNTILYPYFFSMNIYVYPIICSTKRTATKKFRGGVNDYNKVKRELELLCKCHKNSLVTTMFDYYGMPSNTPSIDCTELDLYKRMELIETEINKDIGQGNCRFNFLLHEFEGLLFSSPESFELIGDSELVSSIQEIRNGFETPEHINNSVQTAPSKRLQGLIFNYSKVRNAALLSEYMGIDVILSQCKHFNNWIEMIKNY